MYDNENQPPDTIDTPSLERRVAELESLVQDMLIKLRAVVNLTKDIQPPTKGARNCPHCSRKVMVPPGANCSVCGKKT